MGKKHDEELKKMEKRKMEKRKLDKLKFIGVFALVSQFEFPIWEIDRNPSVIDGPFDVEHKLKICICRCKKDPTKNRYRCSISEGIGNMEIIGEENLWNSITTNSLFFTDAFQPYSHHFLAEVRKQAQILNVHPIME